MSKLQGLLRAGPSTQCNLETYDRSHKQASEAVMCWPLYKECNLKEYGPLASLISANPGIKVDAMRKDP